MTAAINAVTGSRFTVKNANEFHRKLFCQHFSLLNDKFRDYTRKLAKSFLSNYPAISRITAYTKEPSQ